MSLYDSSFYGWVNDTASFSAVELLPIINQYILPKSVIDVGCGRGAWLRAWKDLGDISVLGIDGAYVLNGEILIDRNEFVAADLNLNLPAVGTYDLLQCLEVAEHLDPATSELFISRITKYSDYILFSAAQPGQGGENHINERPLSFWASLFRENGFQCYDFLRILLYKNKKISKWYKYNILLFVKNNNSLKFQDKYGVNSISNLDQLDKVKGDWIWEAKKFVLRRFR